MKRRKILFVINTLGCAGAETALLELLSALEKQDYELSLYVMLGQGEMVHKLPKGVRLLNADYKDCPVLSGDGRRQLAKTVLRSFFRNGKLFFRTRTLLSDWRDMKKRGRVLTDKLLWRVVSDGAQRFDETYDLAVAYLEGASTYYVADYVKAEKKAAFVHIDYAGAGYTPKLDRGCYDAYDRIFAVSDEVREKFLEVYPAYAPKMGVFHNIVNQERIRRLAEEGEGFTDGYQGMRLLTVGRLTRQKAYDVAIDAMKLLRDKGCPARWYVLGEGPERAELEKRIARLGLKDDFILMGAVENPYPYYKQCDIYVHATRYEGKSIAIQEAQTLGCAILASDCNGNREQIKDQVDGRFCGLTAEAVAEAVRALAADSRLRERLGQAAAQKEPGGQKEIGQLLALLPGQEEE